MVEAHIAHRQQTQHLIRSNQLTVRVLDSILSVSALFGSQVRPFRISVLGGPFILSAGKEVEAAGPLGRAF